MRQKIVSEHIGTTWYPYSNSSWALQSALSEEQNLHSLNTDLHDEHEGMGSDPKASPKKKDSII